MKRSQRTPDSQNKTGICGGWCQFYKPRSRRQRHVGHGMVLSRAQSVQKHFTRRLIAESKVQM